MSNDASIIIEDDSQLDYGGLESSLGFMITIAQVFVFAQFDAELGSYGMRPGPMSALILIKRNPGIRHGVLADALWIKPAHMTKLIKGLEADGLVKRKTQPHDRRVVALHLTGKGEEYLKTRAPLLINHDSTRRSGLTRSEEEDLLRLLKAFVSF